MNELRRNRVTVVAGGRDELAALISEATRELVSGTLDAHLAAATDGLVYETTDLGRQRRHRELSDIAALKRQLDETAGPVTLSGPAALVSEVVRDTVAQATHDLDSFVEEATTGPDPLTEGSIADLRAKAGVANDCVEALIACEIGRGRA
jgi:hypothetical protein